MNAVTRKMKPNQSSPFLPKPGQLMVPRSSSCVALDARLLADLAAHAGDDVLDRVELAAQAVVLAEVLVVRAGRCGGSAGPAGRPGENT